MSRRLTILKRIMTRIKFSTTLYRGTPCWLWTGPTSGKPDPENRNTRGHSYPRMTINACTCAVHRVMYTLFFGFVPAKMTVDHECKNRLCVNPSHLSLCSHGENQRRRDGKAPRKNSEYAVHAEPALVAEALSLAFGISCPPPVPMLTQYTQVTRSIGTPVS